MLHYIGLRRIIYIYIRICVYIYIYAMRMIRLGHISLLPEQMPMGPLQSEGGLRPRLATRDSRLATRDSRLATRHVRSGSRGTAGFGFGFGNFCVNCGVKFPARELLWWPRTRRTWAQRTERRAKIYDSGGTIWKVDHLGKGNNSRIPAEAKKPSCWVRCEVSRCWFAAHARLRAHWPQWVAHLTLFPAPGMALFFLLVSKEGESAQNDEPQGITRKGREFFDPRGSSLLCPTSKQDSDFVEEVISGTLYFTNSLTLRWADYVWIHTYIYIYMYIYICL